MYSLSGPLTLQVPISLRILATPGMHRATGDGSPTPEGVAQGEGLLHDARNLMGAVGLYCDLLLVPGVLKPQHRRYAEELRLLGAQSGALMERLSLNSLPEAGPGAWRPPPIAPLGLEPPSPVSLRAIVERSSGLLSRVAGGRPIEVSYGAAASMPVLVAEESVERILANLVRNSAVALDGCAPVDSMDGGVPGDRGSGAVLEMGPEKRRRRAGDADDAAGNAAAGDPAWQSLADRSSRPGDETSGAIRIGVGLLVNRVGESRPWPFQRVRLVVEDSGCGMAAGQLEQVMAGIATPLRSKRGIGLRVVKELVAASNGELRVMSTPGVGTRIQIEWTIAAIAAMDWAQEARTQDAQNPRPSACPAALVHRDTGPSSRRSHPGAAVDSAARGARWASC
jgi:signal transduction histidine kinase